MLEIRSSTNLVASADEVWKTVGAFNGLPDWHPWCLSSELEAVPGGVGRRIRAVNGEMIERLVYFNAQAREYVYEIVGGPVPFSFYQGRIKVTEDKESGTTLEFSATLKPEGIPEAEAREHMQKFFEAGAEKLKQLFGHYPTNTKTPKRE